MTTEANQAKEERSPKMGDIWKEVDPRFTRYVCILSRVGGSVRICTCDHKGMKLRNRETASSVSRFNGKRGGYAYHGRVPVVLEFQGERLETK